MLDPAIEKLLALPFHERFDHKTSPTKTPFQSRMTLLSNIAPGAMYAALSYPFAGAPCANWTVKYAVAVKVVRSALTRRMRGSDLHDFGTPMVIQGGEKVREGYSVTNTTLLPNPAVIAFLKTSSPGEWPLPSVESVSTVIKGEWVVREDPSSPASEDRVILLLHGGAYVAMSPQTHRPISYALAKSSGAKILAIDYRLAPFHPFPCALIDAVSAYLHLCESYDPKNIMIVGDSAGGGLALATSLAVRDMGKPGPRGLYLQSPWCDLSHSCDSIISNAGTDYIGDPEADPRKPGRDHYYCDNESVRLPYVSPFFAELKGMPAMLIQVGGAERLRDEGSIVAERVAQVGQSTLELYEDHVHVFQMFGVVTPAAAIALDRAGAWMKLVFAETPPPMGRIQLDFHGREVSRKEWAEVADTSAPTSSGATLLGTANL